ncbi:MAG: hypothetical protein ACXVNR_08105 [Bacteroidia bacterium]
MLKKIEKKLARIEGPLLESYRLEFGDLSYMIRMWESSEEELHNDIGIDGIDYFQLAFLVTHKRLEMSRDSYRYQIRAFSYKQYRGTTEFMKLLKEYKDKEILPLKISFEFKELYKKRDKGKPYSKEEIETNHSKKVQLDALPLVNFIMDNIHFSDKDMYLIEQAMKDEKNPIPSGTKMAGIRTIGDLKKGKRLKDVLSFHRKNACKDVSGFLEKYNLPERQIKIATMKALVSLLLISDYRDYKNEKRSSNKRIKTEEEYYLQRYTDIIKSRV